MKTIIFTLEASPALSRGHLLRIYIAKISLSLSNRLFYQRKSDKTRPTPSHIIVALSVSISY